MMTPRTLVPFALAALIAVAPLSRAEGPHGGESPAMREELEQRLKAHRMLYLIENAGLTDEELPGVKTALDAFDLSSQPLRQERRAVHRAMRDAQEGVSDREAAALLERLVDLEQAQLDLQRSLIDDLGRVLSPARQLTVVQALREFEGEFRARRREMRRNRSGRGEGGRGEGGPGGEGDGRGRRRFLQRMR